MKRLRIGIATAALAAGLAVAPATAAPGAAPSQPGPPSFVLTTVCTPSWGSIVLPFCV